MTDDIVTRLREGKGNDIDLFKMMDEAADEIERLRAENHGLKVRIFTLINKIESLVVRGE